MRLGLSSSLTHQTPEEWASRLSALGCRAVNFPTDYTCDPALLDRYARAAQAHDLPCFAVKSSCALPTASMRGAASTSQAPKVPGGMDPIGKI